MDVLCALLKLSDKPKSSVVSYFGKMYYLCNLFVN